MPAPILVLTDYPTKDERTQGRLFCGASGFYLDTALEQAKLSRDMCEFVAVTHDSPPVDERTRFPDPWLWIWDKKRAAPPGYLPMHGKQIAASLHAQIAALRDRIQAAPPRLIICMGDLSLFALLGEWSSDNFHGSMFAERLTGQHIKTVCTFSTRRVMQTYSDRMFLFRDFQRAAAELARGPEVWQPAYNFLIRPTFAQAEQCLLDLITRADTRGPLKLACDIETRAYNVACLGFAWSQLDAFCLPFMQANAAQPHYWSADEEAWLLHLSARLLQHRNVQVVGQNFIYDQQYLMRRLGIRARFVRDTMLAQHVLYPDMPKGLDTLSSLYCEHHYYWKGESKDWDPAVGEDQFWVYNCKDAVKTFEIDERQQPLIDQHMLRGPHDFQQRLFWRVLNAMNRGIRVNHASREATRNELAAAIQSHEAWFQDLLGHSLNVGSAPQMKKLFFDDLRLPVQTNRKTGKPTLAGDALTRLAQREPLVRDLIAVIESRRSLGVFLSTFILAPTDEDGRMRCSYNIAGTSTFRFASRENAFGSGMNLQNLPKGDD